MKLMIFMSDTGGGHRSVAEAITASLQETQPDIEIRLLDFFATCSPFPLNQAGQIYGPWINHAAWLWGAGFHLTNGGRRATLVGKIISFFARRAALEQLQAFRPDLLVCVHPLATQLAADTRRRFNPLVPLVTIVTDLVTTHATWLTRDVDLLIAPSDAVARAARQAGIPHHKIIVTGQPVHPRFLHLPDNPHTVRKDLGLNPERFTVLLIGGGEGMGQIQEMAEAIDTAGLPLQQIVICGRNEALRRRLQKKSWRVPTQVLGFAHNMPSLMQAADVVVTKAGPSTICEALDIGRPILLIGYVPGQEKGNVDFVVQNGAGCLTETPQALVQALSRLLNSGGEVQHQMTANARRLARPTAAYDVAHILLNLGTPFAPEMRSAMPVRQKIRG